jgi:hypothetical protein
MPPFNFCLNEALMSPKLIRMPALILATVAVGACVENPMDIENKNNPDVSRVYASPANVETTVSQLFKNMYNGTHGNPDNIWSQTMTMSFESHSQLGNFSMGTRAAIPRNPIDNSIGNTGNTGNFRDYDHLGRNVKSAANTIRAIDGFAAVAATMGSPARDARAKSFAYFTLGYGMGHLALVYDSVAIVTPTQASDEIPPLSTAAAAGTAALEALDSAIAIANSAAATNGANGWPIPADWLSTPGTVDRPTWIRILRSFKARIRAGMPRTPAERNNVDWAAVVADAENGITSDLIVTANATTGWSAAVLAQMRTAASWSQMTPMILGMADSTGAYDAWLATPLMQRSPFLLRTADRRFPSGDTRAIQTAVTGSSKAGPAAGSILYFRNRPPGDDMLAEPWGTWYYDNWRFWGIAQNGGNGPFIIFTAAENDMLAAEGHIRLGNIPAAAALIDRTRVRSGLPALAGVITNATQRVPGGASCVPRVPQPPSFTSTACGTIFEAMKWEKRLETSLTGYSQWFIDHRGWGDLVEGTALEWPVPYQELFARVQPTYTTSAKAVKGTYGF